MISNIPTMLSRDDFETKHSDMLDAARAGRLYDPKVDESSGRRCHAPAALSVVDAETMRLLALARTRDVCPETAKRQEEYRKWRQGFLSPPEYLDQMSEHQSAMAELEALKCRN